MASTPCALFTGLRFENPFLPSSTAPAVEH